MPLMLNSEIMSIINGTLTAKYDSNSILSITSVDNNYVPSVQSIKSMDFGLPKLSQPYYFSLCFKQDKTYDIIDIVVPIYFRHQT